MEFFVLPIITVLSATWTFQTCTESHWKGGGKREEGKRVCSSIETGRIKRIDAETNSLQEIHPECKIRQFLLYYMKLWKTLCTDDVVLSLAVCHKKIQNINFLVEDNCEL